MDDLQQLYQQVILDHARQRTGEGIPADEERPHAQNHQYNPTCGDEITVRVALDPERTVVESVSWEGDGCSISMAAASVLAGLAPGRSLEDFRALIEEFRIMLHSRGTHEPDEERLEDAAAFVGVSKYVARVKCAMLAWVAAEEAAREAALEQ